jgi:hypothetical protein
VRRVSPAESDLADGALLEDAGDLAIGSRHLATGQIIGRGRSERRP